MKCPFCGHQDTQVKDSRPSDDGSAIRRRRSCPNCNGRFTTFERVQLRELVILKRNGRRTPFDRDKLERSIRIGDLISVGTDRGQVQQITTRYTVLRSPSGVQSIVPNETLVSSVVQNEGLSDREVRVAVAVQGSSGQGWRG